MDKLKRWQVTASRTIFKDKWIHVRADDCVTPEGVPIAPYYILEYGDWVQVFAFDEEDKLLLIEQYRHGVRRNSLEPPGGAIDHNDLDPIEAAKRELREETGYTAEVWEYVGKLAVNPATHTNYSHIVLATSARRTSEPMDDPTEKVKLHRWDLGQALDELFAGMMIQSMHVAGLILALRKAGKWSL